MLNILINAYAVSPIWGSEPGMGWNWISNLAKYCNLHIITEGEWQKEIEEAVSGLEQRDRMHFHYLNVSQEVREMCWNQGTWMFYKHYREWELRALEKAREIMAKERIDIVHKLNMIGYREPSYLWKIDGVPFVWGPVGGYGSTPLAYLKGAPLMVMAKELLKNVINYLSFRMQPRVRKAMKLSAAVVGAYKETYEAIRDVYRKDVALINETGAFVDEQARPHLANGHDFNLMWVGKYDLRKQLGLAIRTMALLKDRKNIHLYVAGTGYPEDVQRYKKMVADLCLEDNVHLLGKVPNDKTKRMMKEMDLFFFTSINDATSTVVPEAISAGLPVICHDTRGFGVLVDDGIGRKVAIKTPKHSISSFAEIIKNLEANRDKVMEMSAECIARQKEISWDANARKMVKVYEEVITAGGGFHARVSGEL